MKADNVIVKPNREIKHIRPNLLASCLITDDGQRAWHHNLLRYFTKVKMLKNKMSLVLDERFPIPLNPYAVYSDAELNKLTNLEGEGGLVDQAASAAIVRANKQGQMRVIAWTTSIIVMCITLILIIFAILVATKTC